MIIVIAQSLIDDVTAFLTKHKLAATHIIAKHRGYSTTNTRQLLRAMEYNGIVRRSTYSQRNNIIWELAPQTPEDSE